MIIDLLKEIRENNSKMTFIRGPSFQATLKAG